MKYINKVLLAVDLSDYTKPYVQSAVPIIEQLGCDIILMHCITPLTQVPSEYIPHENISLFIEDTVVNITAQLDELRKEFFPKSNVIIEAPIGEPITLIQEYATRYTCSMIMVGKSVKNSLERFFLGSVASSLISTSKLPILLLG